MKIINKLLYPHPAVTLLLTLFSALGLGWIFSTGQEASAVAYCLYPLSAYSLCTLCLWIIPRLIRLIKNQQTKKALVDQEQEFRKSLISGLTVTLIYALFQLVMGAVTASTWTGSKGAYQLIIAIIHLVLLRYETKYRAAEHPIHIGWKGFRACGIWLLILNLTMTGITFQMIWHGQTGEHPGTMLFAVAAYTFYKLTKAIVRVVQYRKNANPLWGAAKNIDLSEALMNLFTLQSALLSAFSAPEQADFCFVMNSITGTAICLMTVWGAVGMIFHGSKKIKQHQGDPSHG